jgi:hypothetical protein
MCGGWPCNCCAPVTKFDTHFDKERPWKCFFHDRESLVNASRPTGLSNPTGEYFEVAFTKDYAYEHARPMLGPTAASMFTLPTGFFPSSATVLVHTAMARMKWKDYDPVTWVNQLVTVDLSYEFSLSIGSPNQHGLAIMLGDEHDDPDQTYTTAAKAWPNIIITLTRSESSSTNIIVGNIFFANPESAISASGSLRRVTGSTPPQFNDTLQSADLHLELEIRASETRFRGTYAGQTIHFSDAGIPSELIRGARYVRHSPRFRVGVHGYSRVMSPLGQRQPLKLDRWAVSAEPL